MRVKHWAAASTVGALLIGFTLGLESHVGVVSAGDQPAPVTKESSAAFRRVVKQTLPAVVSITAKAKPVKVSRERSRVPHGIFEGAPDEFRKFMEEMMDPENSPPSPRGGFGSGVIVSQDGVILTNFHVVSGAERVEVRLQDGRTFESSDIAVDRKTDLAIVKLKPEDAKDLPVAELGSSDDLEVGDWVLAMGAPFELQGTVTAGIVSAKGRPLGMNMYEDFIQTDAAINPGNSGGPIVNLDGKIVGINTAIRSGTGTFAGIGFAIPSNMAKDVMDHLVKYGKVKRGYLGIQMRAVEKPVLEKLGLKSGVQVQMLTEGDTPARKAGLQPGDIITAVDGNEIQETKELQRFVSDTPAGKTLQFQVNRDGKNLTLPVTIDEQPEDFGLRTFSLRDRPKDSEAVTIEKLGVEVRKTEDGLAITSVTPDSPADKAGLQEGTVILQVEKQEVQTAEDLEKILGSVQLSDGVLLKVRNPDGATRLLVVQE